MVRHHPGEFPAGLNLIVSDAAGGSGMMLDFGIITLGEGNEWSDASERERALLLISGSVHFEWNGESREARRTSCLDENPETLQLPDGMPVKLTAGEGGAELAYEACVNPRSFEPVFYDKQAVRGDVFGAGVMNEASIRTVRTVFDGENAEFSGMVLGEVIRGNGPAIRPTIIPIPRFTTTGSSLKQVSEFPFSRMMREWSTTAVQA